MSDDVPETDLEHLSPEELEALKDPNNAANPVAVRDKRRAKKKADKEAEARNARLRNVAIELLKFEEGQEFFAWWLFEICGIHRQNVNVGMDKDRMLFGEGARAAGLALQTVLLAADTDAYARLLAKHLKEFTYAS